MEYLTDFWYEKHLKNINPVVFFTFLLILHILSTYALIEFVKIINQNQLLEIAYLNNANIWTNVLVNTIVAPIFETLLFQFVIFYVILICGAKTYAYSIYLVASSLLFGVAHSYNWLTIVNGVLAGILLSLVFLFYRIKKSSFAFILTTLFHSLFNGYALIINYS